MNFIKFLIISTSFLYSASAVADISNCKIRYSLKGWSFIYKEYRGNGSITCPNGQQARVSIISRGGGLTVGKSEISNGKGTFSTVKNINEILGTYVAVNAHAGATKSVEAQVVTKGEVSLALIGKGRGVDLGLSIGSFTIKRQ